MVNLTTFLLSATACTLGENTIDNKSQRRSGIDDRRVPWDVFFRCVQSHDQVSFRRLPAELALRSTGKPPLQCLRVDVQNKDLIE